jgi:hypothetical protein
MTIGFTKCSLMEIREKNGTHMVLLKYVSPEFFTTCGTLLEEVIKDFEEVVPPFRILFHMLRRMTCNLLNLGSFE